MIVERDVMDVYRTIYMQKHIGEEFDGRISGFAPFGIYIQLADPFVSVLLPFEQLEDTLRTRRLGHSPDRSADVEDLHDERPGDRAD